MNVVREIDRINQAELQTGSGVASWHEDYKDSAYIFVGGLHYDLTEGDVITIFSQYGEVMDVNLPRDKETGKTKGFGFLMYEDQRSTILAVDNLNGAKVLDRALRVDHVKNYKQPKIQNKDGELVDAEEQSLNAKPQLIVDEEAENSESSDSGPDIDPEDPMRDYLIAKWKEEHTAKSKKKKSKGKSKDGTSEERAARKARKKEKKLRKRKSEGVKGVENLLSSLARRESDRGRSRSRTPPGRSGRRSRTRSRTPVYDDRRQGSGRRSPDGHTSRGHKRKRYSDDEKEVNRKRTSGSRHRFD